MARLRLRFTLVCTVVLVACPSTIFASSVKSITLGESVRRAGVIFAGTVTDIRSEFTSDRETIITAIRFAHLNVVKGQRRGDSITLTLRGGKIGGRKVWVSGQPNFELNGRYVVLAHSDLGSEKNRFLPIVGLFQGFFRVAPSSMPGGSVLDWQSRPVRGVQNERLIVSGDAGNLGAEVGVVPDSRPSLGGVSEVEFLEALRALAGQSDH